MILLLSFALSHKSERMKQVASTHVFDVDNRSNERKTLRLVLLTASMMAIEIVAGLIFGSMALLADGWHMGTHVAALGITLFAYRYASRQANNPRYTFGTGKITFLGGFTRLL
jgi:cation diffusion facilitator family transporter